MGLKIDEVKCDNSKINLVDLEKKLISHEYQALLYQNPGGYFAQQPMQDIYELCKEHDCLVIMDVSGGIGTELCNGQYADLIVGSFGKWKLIDVGNGGFISCKNSKLWDKLIFNDKILSDDNILIKILQKIEGLPKRINELNLSREKILQELIELPIIYPKDVGFVVVIKFNNEREKGKILKYCEKNDLPYTECPRYIRLNDSAISIEVKRL